MLTNQRLLSGERQSSHVSRATGSARGRSGWWTALCAVLLTTVGLAQSSPPSPGGDESSRVDTQNHAAASVDGQQQPGRSALPAAAYANTSAAIGKDQAPYHAMPGDSGRWNTIDLSLI